MTAPPLLGHLLLRNRLGTEKSAGHRILDSHLHFLEELVALSFVFLLGVALAVAPEADAFLEMIECQKMVFPGVVDHPQEDLALEETHQLIAEALRRAVEFRSLAGPVPGGRA